MSGILTECQCAYSFSTSNKQLHTATGVNFFEVFIHLVATVTNRGKILLWKEEWKDMWALSLPQCAPHAPPPPLHHLFFLPPTTAMTCFQRHPMGVTVGWRHTGATEGKPGRGGIRSLTPRVSVSRSQPPSPPPPPPRADAKTVEFRAKGVSHGRARLR